MFLSEQYQLFRNGYKVDLDCSTLMLTASEKLLNEVENAGSKITINTMKVSHYHVLTHDVVSGTTITPSITLPSTDCIIGDQYVKALRCMGRSRDRKGRTVVLARRV